MLNVSIIFVDKFKSVPPGQFWKMKSALSLANQFEHGTINFEEFALKILQNAHFGNCLSHVGRSSDPVHEKIVPLVCGITNLASQF